jgi:hypothetical protein
MGTHASFSARFLVSKKLETVALSVPNKVSLLMDHLTVATAKKIEQKYVYSAELGLRPAMALGARRGPKISYTQPNKYLVFASPNCFVAQQSLNIFSLPRLRP